jgi:hypothetical protein
MNKLLVGSSLSLGFVCLLASTNILFQNKPSEEDKSDAWVSFVIGISSTASGGWLIWDARRKKQKQLEQAQKEYLRELESIFLGEIQSNQGNISYISFAIAAKIPIEQAQQYLEQKSNQLSSTFNIDDDGATSYHFPMSRSLM